ncbi:MAG TPA: CvpA family protein, partial [candidate division Zixibacteria bacterium]|nr:CvpA family protein [candidate division Zixibacteria bacterium]
VVIMLAITLIGHLFKKILKMISLGQFDHLLGFVLGGFKGGLLVAVIATAALWILPGGDKCINDSKIVRADLLALNLVSNALPPTVREKYQSIVERGMLAAKDSQRFSKAFAVPLLYIDSLRATSRASGGTTLRSMLESLGAGTGVEERIPGKVLSWDSDDNRGFVQFGYLDSVRTLPVYPGSFDDSTSAINLIGQDVSFVPAYSELLRCPYAASVQTEQRKD